MIRVGIVGGAGYTAGELIRILLNHKKVYIDFVFSTSNAGNLLSHVHQDLVGDTELKFSNDVNYDVDVLFLCLGHGNSKMFLEKNSFSARTKIIDLSNDFRLKNDSEFLQRDFIYGLTAVNREKIKHAKNIANPGCFATALQLALVPLASKGLLKSDVHINAVTGSTGAGVSPSDTTHFSWRDNNFSTYKEFTHQHLGEIKETISELQSDFDKEIYFLPNRGNFSRGIFATTYTDFDGSEDEAYKIFDDFYIDSSDIVISKNAINMKQVVNTNKALIHLKRHGDKLLISSTIDNLVKGASGQAIQNMNLMLGLEELLGLKIKANYF